MNLTRTVGPVARNAMPAWDDLRDTVIAYGVMGPDTDRVTRIVWDDLLSGGDGDIAVAAGWA